MSWRAYLNIIAVIISVIYIAWKLFTCITCEENFLGITIPWFAFFGFWVLCAVFSFRAYKREKNSIA